MTVLSEAHAPADLLDKVKGLHAGEVARLEGGVAVKHQMTEDGRKQYKVGTPSSYGRGGDPDYYGEAHHTPEDAVKGAFRASARSGDPASIGGTTRLNDYSPMMDSAGAVRIRDWTMDGKAVVSSDSMPHRTRTVDPKTLTRQQRSALLGESLHPAPVPWAATRKSVQVDFELSEEESKLAWATLDALELSESAKTAMLSKTHAPIGKGGKNWITASKPGNSGQMPAYMQNVRNAIMRDGTEESKATEIAVGKVEDWAAGKGGVSPEVKAAAAKAVAEWNVMRGKSKAKPKLAESFLAFGG